MPEQPSVVDVPVYLLVEPRWKPGRWQTDDQGRPILDGGRVVKATQQRPTVRPGGGVVVRLVLRLDAGCFLPLQPEAVVMVHAGNAETVTVEAVDPRAGGDDE